MSAYFLFQIHIQTTIHTLTSVLSKLIDISFTPRHRLSVIFSSYKHHHRTRMVPFFCL